MNYTNLILVALATVGCTEVIKNLIQKGGKRIWTLVTLIVGSLITLVALYLPVEVLYGIVGVSGATVFYDTIFKAFEKLFKRLGGDKSETEELR